MAALFAATHPERTRALILYEAMAKMSWAPDYEWAPTPEERAAWVEIARALLNLDEFITRE